MAHDGIKPLATTLNQHVFWDGAPTLAGACEPVLTQFIPPEESVIGLREQALRQAFDAGLNATDPAEQHTLFLRGLGHAEAWLAAGESAAGVREQALRLFGNVGAVFNLQHWPDTSLSFWIRLWTLAWCGPYAPYSSDAQAFIGKNHEPVWSMLRARPAGRLLTLWHDALRNWLTRQQPATVAPADRRGLWQRMQMAHALLALDGAAAGDGFAGLYRKLAAGIAAIEQPRQQERRRLDAQLRLGLERLQAPGSLEVADSAAVRNWLADWLNRLSPWQRPFLSGRSRQLLALLDQRQALAAAGYGSAAQIAQHRRRLAACETAVIDWIAGQVLRHCGLPAALGEPATVALGLLFTSRHEAADALLMRWQQQAPWQSLPACAEAWPATQPQHWTVFDDGARAALYVWLQHWPELKVDDQLANGAGSDLDAALRAWADGDAQPLCGLLHGGWQAAQEPADKLGRCLSALQPALTAPDLRACSEGPAAVDHAVRIDALAAVLCGRAQARLAQALRDWLDAQCPLPAEGLDDALLARVRQRFSRLCSLHPGPPAQHELGERLHGWAQQWLGDQLAEARPQPEAIWQTLELARIGLNGLRPSLPDADWHEATAEAVREALLNTKALPPGPGLFWPPLQGWFGRLDAPGGLPRLPEVETCRRRLRTGEALVQVLFDPGSGRQLALWLDTRQPLRLRAFPAPANHAAWREGALALWQQWAADEHSQGLARLWPTLIADPAVQVTAATLAGWAAADGLERLIVIWPASLAQLPWEAFAPFVDGAPVLERAVNLGNWRTASAREPAKAWVAHFADSAHGGFAIEAMAADSARFWQVDAQPCGIQAASGFDVLGLLHGGGAGHLIVHGEYRPDEPRLSRLQIATGEYLPAWTLGALGIGCPLLWLSACQANLSGRATRERLGPVGLGPTLIAAGAQRVLGALWKCDTLAAWLLHRFLHAAIAEAAGASPQARYWHALREARERLRALRGSEVEALLRAELGEAVFGERRYEFDDYLLPARPFDNPYYWAAFMLLGEPDAVAG